MSEDDSTQNLVSVSEEVVLRGEAKDESSRAQTEPSSHPVREVLAKASLKESKVAFDY